jgi:hypothetical protein
MIPISILDLDLDPQFCKRGSTGEGMEEISPPKSPKKRRKKRQDGRKKGKTKSRGKIVVSSEGGIFEEKGKFWRRITETKSVSPKLFFWI